jgi:hypothetical protein
MDHTHRSTHPLPVNEHHKHTYIYLQSGSCVDCARPNFSESSQSFFSRLVFNERNRFVSQFRQIVNILYHTKWSIITLLFFVYSLGHGGWYIDQAFLVVTDILWFKYNNYQCNNYTNVIHTFLFVRCPAKWLYVCVSHERKYELLWG